MKLLDMLLRGTVVTSGRGSETALSAIIHENPCILTSVSEHERDRELLCCAIYNTFSMCWYSMLAAATLLVWIYTMNVQSTGINGINDISGIRMSV